MERRAQSAHGPVLSRLLDDRFPFHIYGAQQDEGSIEGPSASVSGAISGDEWQRAAYGESTFVAPQPGDPDITYGSGYFSIFLQYDASIGQYRSISPWPDYQEGASSGELQVSLRLDASRALLARESQAAARRLAVRAAQRRLRTQWQTISPDLTRNDPSTEGADRRPGRSRSNQRRGLSRHFFAGRLAARQRRDLGGLGRRPGARDDRWRRALERRDAARRCRRTRRSARSSRRIPSRVRPT